ncbi:MAG: alpha/beta hydrolase [Pseudomonadota bacterium]
MQRFKTLIGGFAIIYLAFAVLIYIQQRSLQYFPTNRNPPPTDVGLLGVSVEKLRTPDNETLVAWVSPATPGKPTVLFFQGNGGEIADRANRFAAYQRAGFGVLFLSPRGYGGSSGTPSEQGFIIDANAAYDWLADQQTAPASIAVVGESLGTGPAVQLAASREVGALVLGAPFTSAVDIAASQFPWLPVRLLMKDQYRSIDHIGRVTAPTLILHGAADTIVPVSSGRALYEATTAPTTFVALEGAGHSALYQSDTWAQEIDFLDTTFSH